MEKLINETFRNFVVDHILNPYGNMIGIDKRIESFSWVDYYSIIQHAEENPEWWLWVLTRIVKIFDGIELCIFPKDQTATFIKAALHKRGIELIPWGDYQHE